MAPSTAFSLLLLLTIASLSSAAHNITHILESDPDFSQFNHYLTQTKLADEINSRQTITVLALTNSAISALSNLSLSAVKNTLSLHVVLDYYDNKKLHDIQDGTVITTTLYQTTGHATSNIGELNITDGKGGAVKFGSAQPGAKLASTYVKEIKQIPFSLSVIEISSPILVPELMTSTDNVNVTDVLEKAGCKTFASLLTTSGVLKTYETQLSNGLTVFAPNDEAFKAKGVPDLSKLTNADIVSLLQFHALSSYAPIGTLKTTKNKLQTLAPAGKFGLTASTAGDSVTLHTGVDSSRIATTLVDASPVVIYSVDSVLLPVALFGLSPTPAPAPAPESDTPTPAPSPDADTPTPSPSKSPAASPPAPSADSPGKAADEHTKNGGVQVKASLLSAVVLSVASCVIFSVL